MDGLGVGRPGSAVSDGSFVVTDPIARVQGLAVFESLIQSGDGEAAVGNGADAAAKRVVGRRLVRERTSWPAWSKAAAIGRPE